MTSPLFLLPGMMWDARLFGPQVEAYSNQRSVQREMISTADNISALAKIVLSRTPEKFAVAGLSMGGIVAMKILRQAPERIAGLALLDTNPMSEMPDGAARRKPQIEKARSGGLYSAMRDEMKQGRFLPTVDFGTPCKHWFLRDILARWPGFEPGTP